MSIIFNNDLKIFILKTKNIDYQFKINEIGIAQHLYYGRTINDTNMEYLNQFIDRGFSGNPYEWRENRGCSLDLMPQEYSSAGVGDFRVSSIGVVNADGSQSTQFSYVTHEIVAGKYMIPGLPCVRGQQDQADTLIVTMEDPVTNLTLQLYYAVFEEKDVITRTVRLVNTGNDTIRLTKAASFCMDFPYGDFDLIHFHGRHCMERQKEREKLTHDIRVLGSKRGMSSHHQNPFTILCDRGATEDYGDCYGFMLMYSGNHKTEVEMDQAGSVRLVMGLGDENFNWKLNPKETFYAPEAILTYSNQGLNGLSHNFHRIIRENVCQKKYLEERRPVLVNNWEATYFNFDTDKILALGKQAKELGIEMLVLDDGWFGKRLDDNAGLGDWFVNEEKLPGGLKKIADELNGMGLKFGLWFEPEMVNEDSDLYRNHPDWALRDPERNPMMSRNQLVLDMSRQEVVDYLFDSISKILDSANISYVKWDFNRSIANVYSAALENDRQGEVGHRFILGTYQLLERLTKAYPDVMIEGCAGGGGRFDAGILYYCPQIWCSDDTDAIERLEIQEGTSYGYPVSSMGSHVSATPNHQTGRHTLLNTRGIVAMSGTFGYELDLNKLTEEEKSEIKEQIREFKKYYWLIQDGDYYRLGLENDHNYFKAWGFVSKNQKEALLNIVIKKVQANPKFIYVKAKGLKEEAIYQLEGTDKKFSGAALMNGGYTWNPPLGDYPAIQLHFIEVE